MKPARYTEWVPGQSGLCRKTLSWKKLYIYIYITKTQPKNGGAHHLACEGRSISEFKPDSSKNQIWGHLGYLRGCFKTKQKSKWNKKQIQYVIMIIEETYTYLIGKRPNPIYVHKYFSYFTHFQKCVLSTSKAEARTGICFVLFILLNRVSSSQCSWGWSLSPDSPCLCFPRAGIVGIHYNAQTLFFFIFHH